MLTFLPFHVFALQPLIEQANAQTDVNTHALFVNNAGHTVLDEDIGTVGPEAVAAIGDLQYMSASACTTRSPHQSVEDSHDDRQTFSRRYFNPLRLGRRDQLDSPW